MVRSSSTGTLVRAGSRGLHAVQMTKASVSPEHIVTINRKCNAFAATPSGTVKALKEGACKVYLALCDNDHAPPSERPRPKTASVTVHGGPGR